MYLERRGRGRWSLTELRAGGGGGKEGLSGSDGISGSF